MKIFHKTMCRIDRGDHQSLNAEISKYVHRQDKIDERDYV